MTFLAEVSCCMQLYASMKNWRGNGCESLALVGKTVYWKV